MRIDVVSIFPDYLAPLELSLLGRARASGLVSLHVHDLRAWTHDRHRTVDDTPYGGGPGMVMTAEPWGRALDSVLTDGGAEVEGRPAVVVPTPAGRLFTQAAARRLASRPWLVFACGRYEGIDQRVADHYATRADVLELSIGDYVLSGGEAAALVVIEAVTRLIPGFVGNPGSLTEESHEEAGDRLLEYPVYTKPPHWRGLDVPEVLLSGNHAAIAVWRREQSVRRTAARRPHLAHPSQAITAGSLESARIRLARPADAGQLLTLRRACWAGQAPRDAGRLSETLDDVRQSMESGLTFVVECGGRLVASVRGGLSEAAEWEVGRPVVAPDLAGRELERALLAFARRQAPPDATISD